ncbi:MAG: hypothetical protein HZB70_00260 [Candidatus Berkelbacteria bacterium]|nr:MAG: hypothetical protein HZB70_00260 [Candidatus Berkelbacteria bacterium]QQG51460.1 MAG: hypothetical protein HY845_02740 [Candidatus Berkelbacteria bacterium]
MAQFDRETKLPGYTLLEMLTVSGQRPRKVALPGYTLLEMLISVAIFSGLVILILAVFVRTTGSAARVSVLREKSEAARSAIARITNDFRYIYYDKQITLGDPGDNGWKFTGFYFINDAGFNDVVMLLKHPKATDQQLVFKRYSTTSDSLSPESRAIKVREFRGCKIELINGVPTVYLSRCDNFATAEYQSMLDEGYVLNNDINKPIFNGVRPNDPVFSNITGYLRISMNFKSIDYLKKLCGSTEIPDGACYKVETVLTAEGVRS